MQNLENLIEECLNEFTNPDGTIAFRQFRNNSEVDLKISEFRTLLTGLTPDAIYLLNRFDNDKAIQSGDIQTRTRILAAYCITTLKLLKGGVIRSRGTLISVPDLSKLTQAMPGLESIIADRWLEIQTCLNIGAHLSAIILMGSILEALLLSRAMLDPVMVQQAKRSPKENKTIQEWSLSELITVAIELHWIKIDPTKFSFPLRKYQHIVHPWGEVTANVDLSAETCDGCWKVVNKSVEDLLKSL